LDQWFLDTQAGKQRLRVQRGAAMVVGLAHLPRGAGQAAQQQGQRQRQQREGDDDFQQRIATLP
jgi:hypothetical protein